MRRWTMTAVVAIGLTGTPHAEMAEPENPITVLVRVSNQAEIPQDVLTQALTEATRIYHDIGVTLLWTENPAAVSGLGTRIISRPLGESRVIDRRALGAAPGTRDIRGRIAYAFYGPIKIFAEGSGTDVSVILGHVIAHELGHLLLPHGSHTMIGVMGTVWDRARVQDARAGELTFTRDQKQTIRKSLENGK